MSVWKWVLVKTENQSSVQSEQRGALDSPGGKENIVLKSNIQCPYYNFIFCKMKEKYHTYIIFFLNTKTQPNDLGWKVVFSASGDGDSCDGGKVRVQRGLSE